MVQPYKLPSTLPRNTSLKGGKIVNETVPEERDLFLRSTPGNHSSNSSLDEEEEVEKPKRIRAERKSNKPTSRQKV
ncbi:unnamed protein product [Calypogeia fissa]